MSDVRRAAPTRLGIEQLPPAASRRGRSSSRSRRAGGRSTIANPGAAASPASTDAAGGACRPRDASRPPSRAVRLPRKSSPPDRRRTAVRPSSGSAPARSDLHGRGVARSSVSHARSASLLAPRRPTARCPSDTHAPHVVGYSASERFDASDVVTPQPECLPSHRHLCAEFRTSLVQIARANWSDQTHLLHVHTWPPTYGERQDHRMARKTIELLPRHDGRFWPIATYCVAARTWSLPEQRGRGLVTPTVLWVHGLVRGHPLFRRQFECRKIESRRDRAADQRPVAGAFGRLPRLRRHDGLRHFARGEIGAEPDAAPAVAVGDFAESARCRRNNARPRPHRCDASASARRAPAGNRSRSKARVRWRRGAYRETSRDNARLRDAASVQAAR